MMVFDETNEVMSNKTAPPISSPSESKLDTRSSSSKSGKSLPRRSSSSKTRRTSLTKSVGSASSEQKARVSENLKKSIAKELKSSKSSSKSGGRGLSPSPLGRSASSKIVTKEKKDKKKKKKKSLSDTSLRTRDLEKDGSVTTASDFTTSAQNSSFPLHTNSPLTGSESTGKKKVKRRISTKRSKLESSTVAELIDNHKGLGISDHSTDTVSTSGSIDDDTSKKTVSKKKGKRPENRKSKAEEKSSSEEDDAVPLTFSPEGTSKKQVAPKTHRRPMSFESIHGKSIHKPTPRRGSMTNATTDISDIRDGNHDFEASPAQTYGTLTLSPSPGSKKKSVLKAKREKQILKHKQEHEEEEKKEPKSRSSAQKKKEDYIHEVLDIVNSSQSPKNKTVDSRSRFEASNDPVDPDECSSQSSSCSIVSDGSYEKDDLLSNTSDHSDERNSNIETPENFSLEENPSLEEASFATEVESPTKSSLSDRNASPSEGSYSETLMKREESFKSTLIEAMASSMSALQEEDEEDESLPKPVKKSVMKKSGFKTFSSGKPPLRLVPKRSQSDVTSLKSMNNMTNNVLKVKLPGQRKSVTRQRSLTFNEKVRVKRIPCQAQVCEGDVSDLWFQPEEYDAIKRKTMALIRAVQDDQTGGVTYCTRGLERYFSVDDVQEKRNDAWDSVLDEQELQRANNEVFNADRMSKLYAETTKLSSAEALERGKLDEDAIARYTKKMRQTLRRTYSLPV